MWVVSVSVPARQWSFVMKFFFPFFWWHCVVVVVGSESASYVVAICEKISMGQNTPSNADLLYLPRTPPPHKYLRSTSGTRGWPGPAPREAELDQALNGTQWASLISSPFSFSFPFLHACLSRAPMNGRVCLPLPAAQVSWTLLSTFSMRRERSNPKLLVWFKE